MREFEGFGGIGQDGRNALERSQSQFFTVIFERCEITVDLKGGDNLFNAFLRRGDRVADRASLERMCTGNGTEGSNPSLSAIIRE